MTQNCRDTNTNCIKTAKSHNKDRFHTNKNKKYKLQTLTQTADTNCKHRYKVKLQTNTLKQTAETQTA